MQHSFVIDERFSELRDLLGRLERLRAEILVEGPSVLRAWGVTQPDTLPPGLANLADYVVLRRHDLRDLQARLAQVGLSSLGRSEARVLTTLDALIATLQRLCGREPSPYPPSGAMWAGEAALGAEIEGIFGPCQGRPHVHIMATLPSEAATDPALLERLMRNGMECARINCAHDDSEAWGRMIAHIRDAERKLGGVCRILMDLAGPKCRVSVVRAHEKLRLHRGDRLVMANDLSQVAEDVAFKPSLSEIIGQLRVGAEVWINDGKLGTRVIAVAPGRVDLEVFSAREKGERLKPEKGLNFPSTEIAVSPLTKKDFEDLDFVARHADLVGFSFVQRPADVELLQDHLSARRTDKPPQAIVLKIETPLAVKNLPQLVLQSAKHNPTAVMIARGDLAVELSFARLAEMQEEILWLCEAAHVPVIWATQVLDHLVREGVPSRAETTDAAMAQRADCVMLNKGPYLAEGIAFLRDILARMDRHQSKKFARLAPLHAW